MKKRLAVMLVGTVVCAAVLSGCSAGNEASNDYVTVGGYKGIEVSAVEKGEVTDEDIDSRIEAVLNQHATEETITDRAVEDGDTVDIDFVGKIDGVEFDGGSAENYSLGIGSGAFIDGFEDSIIGHETGDTFDWNGAFPEDYGNEELNGKDVTFTITVNSITKATVPELTDDFVKTVSEESQTVEEYREEIRVELEEAEQSLYDSTLQASVWAAVMENAEIIEYPEDRVKEFSDVVIQQYKDAAEDYGMEYEDFLKVQMGYTAEEFEQQMDEVSQMTVKHQLVAEVIADEEGLRLTEEELQKEYEEMLERYGYESMDDLVEAAGGENALEILVVQNVVKEWLADNCVQVRE